MTARSLGEVLGGLAPAKRLRSHQPVRRNSYDVSDRRSTTLWQPLAPTKTATRQLIAARLRAAELYDRAHKLPGKQNGALGAVGMEVLRELYRLMDYKTGRLEPALSTLCKRIKRSRQAVSDALERLEAHGFIKRVRRSEQTFCKGAGPQVRQVTNAYALCMPPSAQRFVEKRLDDGPPARCELDRQEADAAQTRDMLAQATAGEQIRFLAGDAPCTDVLESMLIMIQQRERESTKQGESIPEFYISAGCSRSPKIAKGAPKRVYL